MRKLPLATALYLNRAKEEKRTRKERRKVRESKRWREGKIRKRERQRERDREREREMECARFKLWKIYFQDYAIHISKRKFKIEIIIISFF